MNYPAICEVEYFDEFENCSKISYNLIYAKNFTDAMHIIEEAYGDNLISAKIILCEGDSLIEVSEEKAEQFLQNGWIE